jgi:plastocyanin
MRPICVSWADTRAAALLLALAAAPAWPRTFEVTANPDMTFTPASLTIYQRDRVLFRNGGGLHNVVADDNSFRCAVNCNTNTAPSAAAWSAGVRFTRLGAFGYYCEQHGDVASGMRGLIVVIDRVFVDGFDALVLRGE